MKAARWPRDDPRSTRLLRVDPARGELSDGTIGDLRSLLRRDDLLVVNDAATMPACLAGLTEQGTPVEARLAAEAEDGTFQAVLFGAGDWRTRTEDRPPPPRLAMGDALRFDGLRAIVSGVDEVAPRLVRLAFEARGAALFSALYRAGRPVQYAHTRDPLSLWHVQTAYSGRPWAAEAPSAGFALTWDLLLDLRRRGVGLASVTHAAGLSSTGDAALDARLPLAERYDIPARTVLAIDQVRSREGRVVAVGTTVARALEGAAANANGTLAAGPGLTDLRLGPQTQRGVVDAIVTGMHEAATSHFALLQSFAPVGLLALATGFAEARGYQGHEFGDAMLILDG
ncbi:MAG TPA: S-adenosylmethionine:tRNA ribosyltransferase-isomerase [Myxococcales bacterium]|nr:S-adenosylmethionine:tRNA ribosyltransferase-isomerase [Myxococcales bacterium]